MIYLIDNYDSFVHNLARYLRLLGQETLVVRNDQTSVQQIADAKPDAIVISPGPCAPQQAGCCLEVVRRLHDRFPMLGVCLGHQVIAEAFGGEVVRATTPAHGCGSLVQHHGTGVFTGLPSPLRVGRYHSLIAESQSLPDCLHVDATLADGTIMAFSHRQFPLLGWQFHPESVLTQCGYEMLISFLQQSGVSYSGHARAELDSPIPEQPDWFRKAIEFNG